MTSRRAPRRISSISASAGFHLVVDSVLSQAVVSELVHRCDVVYHLAAAVGVQLIVDQPGRTLLTNVQGAENVLEYCARFEKPVLVASSSEVYGNHPEDMSLEEDALRHYGPTTAKRWAYADTKALKRVHRARPRPRARPALRHRTALASPSALVRAASTATSFHASSSGRWPVSLEIHGDGSQTRCFCHVSDVVRALRGLLEGGRPDLQRRLDGADHSDLATRIVATTGSSSELLLVPYEQVFEAEMFHRAPSIDKIAAAILGGPRSTLDGILADVIGHTRTPQAPSPT